MLTLQEAQIERKCFYGLYLSILLLHLLLHMEFYNILHIKKVNEQHPEQDWKINMRIINQTSETSELIVQIEYQTLK